MAPVGSQLSFTGESGRTWRYWIDQQLGSPGGFGKVLAAEADDGTAMAVKRVVEKRDGSVLDARLLRREVAIGRKVREGPRMAYYFRSSTQQRKATPCSWYWIGQRVR